MLWGIIKFLVGILAVVIMANVFFGFVKLAVAGKVISVVVSLGLIALLVYLIRVAV